MIHDDKVTGWTFETPSDSSGKPLAGGLVLQKMRHQGHNFARDIRMVGVWIEVEHVDDVGTVTSTDNPILRTLDAAFDLRRFGLPGWGVYSNRSVPAAV